MFRKKIKNEKGFTLVELIVVITILAILSVIGIQAVGPMISKAKCQTDTENAQVIGNAISVAFAQGNITSVYSSATALSANTVCSLIVGTGKSMAMLPPVKMQHNGVKQNWYFTLAGDGSVVVYAGTSTTVNTQLYPRDEAKFASSSDYQYLMK